MKSYEYSTKIQLSHLIWPALGVAAMYFGLTAEFSIGIKNTVILPYPVSNYFTIIVGVLLVLQFLYVIYQSTKSYSIDLMDNEFIYTKGTLVRKTITVKYKALEEIKFKEDDDDGKYICIDSGKFSDHEFYEDKFKNKSEYADFCEEITAIAAKQI